MEQVQNISNDRAGARNEDAMIGHRQCLGENGNQATLEGICLADEASGGIGQQGKENGTCERVLLVGSGEAGHQGRVGDKGVFGGKKRGSGAVLANRQ